ncbi:hypothetical protein, partial [Amycolatopsis sp. NPDC059657]|uniref:hypothetical protein n=1 Tax=Amycolatopsis sp. NPDC059657 TaxID=3346899 RepID=UPI00366B9B08
MVSAGRNHIGRRLWSLLRATALVVLVALVASLTQAVALPPSSVAAPLKEVPRDLPVLSTSSVPSRDKSHQVPEAKQPKADFKRLAPAGAAARRSAAAPETSLVGPVDDAVVGTETPVLQVAAVGDEVLYCFKVSTGFDGRSGSVVDSG